MDFLDDFDLIKYVNSDDDKLFEHFSDLSTDFESFSFNYDFLDNSLLEKSPYPSIIENYAESLPPKLELNIEGDGIIFDNLLDPNSSWKKRATPKPSLQNIPPSRGRSKKKLGPDTFKIIRSLLENPSKPCQSVNNVSRRPLAPCLDINSVVLPIQNTGNVFYVTGQRFRRLLPREPREETKLEIRPRPCLLFRTRYVSALHKRLAAVYSLPIPREESHWTLRDDEISDEERELLPEFFKNLSTVDRYLRIRKHIVMLWNARRPKYLCKTAARYGLHNRGDVHLISRVHLYLERKGFINFGCDLCHYNSELRNPSKTVINKRHTFLS